MTDVLERGDAQDETAVVDLPEEADAVAPVTGGPAVAESLRLLVAALSAAAGAIHLAMVPSHMEEWATEGVAFAVAGWAQLALAALVMIRPSRAVLGTAIAANLGLVAAWAVTRTAGAPFGPNSGHSESASFVDLTTVGFELALVALAAFALLRPGAVRRVGSIVGRGAFAGTAAVVLLAGVALTSPSARDHAAGSHGHGAEGESAGEMSGGHAHGGEGAADDVGGAGMATRPDDRGLADLSNGHHDEMVVHDLDAETQAALDDQLAVTREVAAAYPTVAAAEAAGYRRIGPYFPGIGAHYGKQGSAELNRAGDMTRDTLLHPFAIIYNGTEPTSRVAGFMYLSLSETEPEGFAGPEVWHYHEQLCLKYRPDGQIDVPYGLDHQATEAQCTAAGARLIDISPWMVHVWSAPGWDDDPEVGTFGEVHTDLTCSDGTYYMLPIEQWVDHSLNVCRADAA